MRTNNHKGDHGKTDGGAKKSGNQKAVFGSGINDAEVAAGQAEARGGEAQQETQTGQASK